MLKQEFIRPKTPNATKGNGYIIIESDDNKIGDYTHWYPYFKDFKYDNTDWINTSFMKLGLNINSGNLDQGGYIKSEQLKTMYDYGFEVINHGMYHSGVGKHKVTSKSLAGDDKVYIDNSYYFGHGYWITYTGTENYVYDLVDSSNNLIEKVLVKKYDSSNSNSNAVTLRTPLKNNIEVGSFMRLSKESIDWFIGESLAIIERLGIENVNSVTPPYHSGSHYVRNEMFMDYLKERYDSIRGIPDGYNERDSLDLNELKARGLRGNTTKAQIDSWINHTVDNQSILIVYGHGESDEYTLDNLKYVINQSIKKGIVMINRSKLVKLFN